MRTLVRITGLFVFLTLIAHAAPAAAQSVARERTLTVTPFLGTTAGISEEAGNSALLGVAVGYDWTSNLGFEGEIAHLFDVAGDNADIDWSVTNFSANAIYHFDVVRVTPYATFGIGFQRSGFEVTNPDPLALVIDRSGTEVAFNFGGGVKYALNDRFLARGDLRRFQANDDSPDYWRLYGGITWQLSR